MIATDARAQANPHPFFPSLKFASCAVSDCVWLRSRRLQRRPPRPPRPRGRRLKFFLAAYQQ